MHKYSTISTIKINGIPYNIHKHILQNIPFFDDFIKDSDEEIDIQIDQDIDSDLVVLLIDNLYGSKLEIKSDVNYIRLFNLFRLADYLCVDIKCDSNKYENILLKDAVDYAIENDLIDEFAKFVESFGFAGKISVASFSNYMNYELIIKINKIFRISDITYLLQNNYDEIAIQILENNKWNRNILYIDFNRFFSILVKKLSKKDNIEHNKIIIEFILNEKHIEFSHYYYRIYYCKEALKEMLYREFC